jgi:hypothetical protein
MRGCFTRIRRTALRSAPGLSCEVVASRAASSRSIRPLGGRPRKLRRRLRRPRWRVSPFPSRPSPLTNRDDCWRSRRPCFRRRRAAWSTTRPSRSLLPSSWRRPERRRQRLRPETSRSTAGSATASCLRGSVRGSAAGVEPRFERAAQQLAGHVSRPARDPLRLHPGDADYLTASLSVTARVCVGLADRRCLALRPSAEEREEPPEHATSVAETRRGA